MFRTIITLTLLSVAAVFTLTAQSQHRLEYIETYKDIAIQEMNLYGIPASIKLAQGILESGDGKSRLATKANNHFGIKCHTDWKGKKIYHDDDEKGECFRVYKQPEESYRDHSLFLVERPRYKDLFTLDRSDYKGWAKGLKEAGYATNPKYASLLIKLIEDYQLYIYDSYGSDQDIIFIHPNRVRYTVVRKGESLEGVSDRSRVSVKRIIKYNEFNWETQVEEGDVVFLQRKRNKGKGKAHVVRAGETMHDIAQEHAIRLDKLYGRNRMQVGQQPNAGDTLKLRGRKKK
ncbi:MAG: glucosaminidase domain-containing protein [Cryomorphaceae bacterium]|nr:glucosaminidase domain-containing protein [Cryomorphaceae bacterium]